MARGKCEFELVLNIEEVKTVDTPKVKVGNTGFPNTSKFRITPFQNMLSAMIGGLVTTITMTPLDVVKTRMQMKNESPTKFFYYCNGLMDHLCPCETKADAWYRRPSNFTSTFDGFRRIVQCEGVFSLWSGLTPTLALALPTAVFFFASYEELKFRLNDNYTEGDLQPLWVPFAAASITRILATLISSPLELIRTNMQAKNMSYLQVHQALKTLLYFEGIRGLWKGVGATLMRDVPFSGLYWTGYEGMKSMDIDFKMTFASSFLFGTASGVISSVLTTPFDVVKTHIQIETAEEIIAAELATRQRRKTMLSEFNKIYTENGVKGLFTGLLPRTIRVAPSCAIMVATFEYLKSFFEDHNIKIEING